jgi:prepilin-type N-terminal cleavage/methylation domain-containing protein
MRRRRKVFPEKETGLTLVEVLLVLALLGMVVTAVYGFYFSGVVAWQKGVQQMDGQQNARIAMDRIIDDLRFAYSIDESVPGQVAFEVKGSSGALERYRIRLTNNEIVCEKLSESGVVQSHT